jgi:hypothetical protein
MFPHDTSEVMLRTQVVSGPKISVHAFFRKELKLEHEMKIPGKIQDENRSTLNPSFVPVREIRVYVPFNFQFSTCQHLPWSPSTLNNQPSTRPPTCSASWFRFR